MLRPVSFPKLEQSIVRSIVSTPIKTCKRLARLRSEALKGSQQSRYVVHSLEEKF